jgi:hypothetical protein
MSQQSMTAGRQVILLHSHVTPWLYIPSHCCICGLVLCVSAFLIGDENLRCIILIALQQWMTVWYRSIDICSLVRYDAYGVNYVWCVRYDQATKAALAMLLDIKRYRQPLSSEDLINKSQVHPMWEYVISISLYVQYIQSLHPFV